MPARHDDDERYETEKTIPGTLALEEIPRVAKPHVLEQIRGPGSPARFVLDRERMVVGRANGTDVQVDSAELSRQHLVLTKIGAEFHAEDMNSRNGVFLNGVKIHGAVLREADQLQLGDVIFIYHEGR